MKRAALHKLDLQLKFKLSFQYISTMQHFQILLLILLTFCC